MIIHNKRKPFWEEKVPLGNQQNLVTFHQKILVEEFSAWQSYYWPILEIVKKGPLSKVNWPATRGHFEWPGWWKIIVLCLKGGFQSVIFDFVGKKHTPPKSFPQSYFLRMEENDQEKTTKSKWHNSVASVIKAAFRIEPRKKTPALLSVTYRIYVWYIYLHENHTNQLNVSKYTGPIDGMGYTGCLIGILMSWITLNLIPT